MMETMKKSKQLSDAALVNFLTVIRDCMLILVNRAEEELNVHREIEKFLTVYRVCYTPWRPA